MKKMFRKLIKGEDGYTFIELLVSILLLGFIVVAFMNTFLVSTKSNISTFSTVDAGYVAQDVMEEIYYQSKSKLITDFKTKMMAASYNWTAITAEKHTLTKDIDNYYVKIDIEQKAFIPAAGEDLSKVVVKVYEDSAHTKLVASVQNILILKGDLS